MNEMTTPAIKGEEHWTTKDGGVKLFLFEKCVGDPAKSAARSCSCTARRWPRSRPSTCRCPGGPIPRRWITSPSAATTAGRVDMEGYGRSTKDRDNNAPIAQGADDCYAAALYIQKLRGQRPLLVYGISSGALRAAMFAERHPEMVGAARTRRHGVDRRRLARRSSSAARSCRNSSGQEPAADRQGLHPFDVRPRPSRHRRATT